MSYRSQVCLVVTNKINKLLWEKTKAHEGLKHMLLNPKDKQEKDSAVLYYWDWIKWHTYIKENGASVINTILQETEKENYYLVTIGEDCHVEESGEFTEVFNPEPEINTKIVYE